VPVAPTGIEPVAPTGIVPAGGNGCVGGAGDGAVSAVTDGPTGIVPVAPTCIVDGRSSGAGALQDCVPLACSGGDGGCAGGGVPLGAEPALSWCGCVSLGGPQIGLGQRTVRASAHGATKARISASRSLPGSFSSIPPGPNRESSPRLPQRSRDERRPPKAPM